MGKSDITTVVVDSKKPEVFPYILCNSDEVPLKPATEIALSLNNLTMTNTIENFEIFPNQVAGHTFSENSLGLILQTDGTVLKPIPPNKLECGEREIDFYESLQITKDESLKMLCNFIPKYYGVKHIKIRGQEIKCIILEDLTKGFSEPCVMDIKIGRRTWDPDASREKIMKEEKKFVDCKRDLGFCIPGFQVYQTTKDGSILKKFDKTYGKSLNKDTVREALRVFLNGEKIFCRKLLVQILATLWQIQSWARTQRRIQLFSSSILLVYDAKRLRENLPKEEPSMPKTRRSASLYRPLSLAALNNNVIATGFSGQLTVEGPILEACSRRKKSLLDVPLPKYKVDNVWQKSMHSLKRTHSFQNNYDKNVQSKKQDYTHILEDLCCDHKSELWSSVKMIDFAHIYPGRNCDIDRNFLEGVENLVKIFEEFLLESE